MARPSSSQSRRTRRHRRIRCTPILELSATVECQRQLAKLWIQRRRGRAARSWKTSIRLNRVVVGLRWYRPQPLDAEAIADRQVEQVRLQPGGVVIYAIVWGDLVEVSAPEQVMHRGTHVYTEQDGGLLGRRGRNADCRPVENALTLGLRPWPSPHETTGSDDVRAGRAA